MPAREATIRALATDYDRTLTGPDLRPSPRAMDALQRARKEGLAVIAISGRDLEFLHRELGDVVDIIVGENGCLLLEPGSEAIPLGDHQNDLKGTLACLDIPLEHGRILASADIEHEPLLRETLEREGYRFDLIRNRDRVMVLPKGIDKAVGVMAALKVLGIPPEQCAAAGDGENDIPLLKTAGYGIAVSNAVPELKELADHVTQEYGGDGLGRWLDEVWLASRTR